MPFRTHEEYEEAVKRYVTNKDRIRGFEDAYTTQQEAEARARELGGSGFHTHEYDGETIYMPFETHEEYEEAVKMRGHDHDKEWHDENKVYHNEKATYNDYPQSASNNAKRMIEWREKYGRDEVKGGTAVGWQRAASLSKRESISAETVGRMASFNRHKKNSTVDPKFKDTPWKDKGYVAWNLWGGTSGVNWAIKKMETIRNND